MKENKLTASLRSQFLVNELVNCAKSLDSEYPMKALHASKRVELLKEELIEHIKNLEHGLNTKT